MNKFSNNLRVWLPTFWRSKGLLNWLLLPASCLYRSIVFIRRSLYRRGLLNSHSFSEPVVVVGNLSVGGSGKTPMVIYLSELLKTHGYSPGIVTGVMEACVAISH